MHFNFQYSRKSGKSHREIMMLKGRGPMRGIVIIVTLWERVTVKVRNSLHFSFLDYMISRVQIPALSLTKCISFSK